MRHDTAVSEVLGAVFLIGIVIVAIAIIGTSLLSEPPVQGSKYPKATVGAYCVECSMKYEIIVKHDGGEAFPTENTNFLISTKNGSVEPDDIDVFTEEPPECSVAGSRGGRINSWATQSLFGPGMIAKVVVNKGLNDTVNDAPTGITILYNNDPGPGGIGSQYFQEIKNQTVTSYNPDTGNETEKIQELMTGKFEPEMEPSSITEPDEEGYCTAVFYYSNSLDMKLKVTPCPGDAMILDSNGNPVSGASCAQPWNEFVGVGPGDYSWLRKNMGQPTEFLKNDESSKNQRSFTVRFRNGIQWRLANGVSATALCEGGSCNCAPMETCIWGYMYYDTNGNGVKDSDEPGFTDGVINITGRYKNNPNTPNIQYDVSPGQTGIWKSQCIHMSGWAFDIIAKLSPGYSTNDEYIDYDEKMTGQDKKNPPRLDFGVTGAPVTVVPTTPPPTTTPTPVPTVIPVDTGGVGAQLYSGGNDVDVIVEFAYSSAGYKNVFKLSSPNSVDLGWSQGEMPNGRTGTAIGTTWNLGTFSNGTELIFADTANGQTYYTGPASRNPDGIVHGAVTYIGPVGNNHKYLVTFEDYYGGGDKDYNDLEFYVTGNLYVLSSTPTPAPTPAPEVDTEPPTISGVSASLSSNKKIVTISWTAEDNFGVDRVVIRISTDGGNTYPEIIRDSSWTTNPGQTKSGSFNWDSNKNYSSAKFKVIVNDEAGNTAFKVSNTVNDIKR